MGLFDERFSLFRCATGVISTYSRDVIQAKVIVRCRSTELIFQSSMLRAPETILVGAIEVGM